MAQRERDDDLIGESAWRFMRWFPKSHFSLMEAFLEELRRPATARDPAEDERRFLRALRLARRALIARVVVSTLLVFGVVATAAAAIARFLYLPAVLTPGVDATLGILDRVAAVSGSATLLLLGLRLGFDRYLQRVEVAATFMAMQLASGTRRP